MSNWPDWRSDRYLQARAARLNLAAAPGGLGSRCGRERAGGGQRLVQQPGDSQYKRPVDPCVFAVSTSNRDVRLLVLWTC